MRRIKSKPDSISREGGRFIFLGIVNTLLTFALYQFLLLILPPTVSYTFAYIAGLIFVSIYYPRFVFRVNKVRTSTSFSIFGYYIVSYLAGLGLLSVFNTTFGFHPRVSIVLVIGLLLPVNFIVTRILSLAKKM